MGKQIPDGTKFLTSTQVRERYGNLSKMSLHRWIAGGKFPKPYPFNGRNYWKLADLEAYEREAARATAGKAA